MKSTTYYSEHSLIGEMTDDELAQVTGGDFNPNVLGGVVAGVAIQMTAGVAYPLVNDAIDSLWQPQTLGQAQFKAALLDPAIGIGAIF
jgi:bacteriocin-like protein